MKKVITYFFIISVGFFWGCLDFDRIIDYRETIYGDGSEFGKEVELSRVAKTGDGNSSFEKNSLFIQSANDFFMYQNPNSYWDHTFTFSEEGLTGDFDVSPNGEIIAVAVEPKDSSDTSVEFYIQNTGQIFKLDRDLNFGHTTSTEYLQEFQLMDENHISFLFRDDSLEVNRFKIFRYDTELSEWSNTTNYSNALVDLIDENPNRVEKFYSLFDSSWDNYYYIITIDEEYKFNFYMEDSFGTGWWQPRYYGGNGETINVDSTFYAYSADFDGNDLVLSRIKNDSTYLEHYAYDLYRPNFYRTNDIVQDTIGFLANNSSIQIVQYDNRNYVLVGNTADSASGLNAAIRLFQVESDYEYGEGSWQFIEEINGVDQFASSFDVSIEASTLVIGEPSNDFISNNAGAVHVYDISLNENQIELDREVNVQATGDYRDRVHLEWADIGYTDGFIFERDPIGYKVLRKIWESGSNPIQIADIDSIGNNTNVSFIDTSASLDTNYVYTILPYNVTTNKEGDVYYHIVESSAIARPIRTEINPEFNIPFADSEPILDAHLTEPVWEDAAILVNKSHPKDTVKILESISGIYIGVKSSTPEDFRRAILSVSIDTDKNLDWTSENEGIINFEHSLNENEGLVTSIYSNHYQGTYPDIVNSNNVNLSTLWSTDYLSSVRIDTGRLFQEIFIPFSEILFGLDQYESIFLQVGLNYTPWLDSFSGISYPIQSHPLVQETFYKANLSTSSVNNEIADSKTESFELNQNYPNPFNPSTNISFDLPQSELVQLKVYNMLGQEVASLVDGRLNSGNHMVNFDASQLSSGVYIYRLVAGNHSITKKMMLIK